MCRGEEHTTRQAIPWGMSEDMPHPCVRRYSTDKSVTKGLPFAISRERTFLCLAQLRNAWSVYDRERRCEDIFGGMRVGVYNGPQVQAGTMSGMQVE